MLSHINKRVKGHAAIALPLADLVALYQKPGAAPMTRNFALVYVEMAAGRATPEQRLAVVRPSAEQPGSCTSSVLLLLASLS